MIQPSSQIPTIVQSATGTPLNKEIVVKDNGDQVISWNSLNNAASYKVNMFIKLKVIDGTLYFYSNDLSNNINDTNMTLSNLIAGTDYTYQVIALNANGSVLAAYQPVDITIATTSSDSSTSVTSSTTISTAISATTSIDDSKDKDENVNTGDNTNLIILMALISLLTFRVLTLKKKKFVK